MAQTKTVSGPGWLGWGIVATGVLVLILFEAWLYLTAM